MKPEISGPDSAQARGRAGQMPIGCPLREARSRRIAAATGTAPAQCNGHLRPACRPTRRSRRQVNSSGIIWLLAAESREYWAYTESSVKSRVSKFSSFRAIEIRAIEIPRFSPHLPEAAFRRGLGRSRCAGEQPRGHIAEIEMGSGPTKASDRNYSR